MKDKELVEKCLLTDKELVKLGSDILLELIGQGVGLDHCGNCCNFDNENCQHEDATGDWDSLVECPQERLFCDTYVKQIIPIIQKARDEEIKRELESWIMGMGIGNEAGVKYDWQNEWLKFWKDRGIDS